MAFMARACALTMKAMGLKINSENDISIFSDLY